MRRNKFRSKIMIKLYSVDSIWKLFMFTACACAWVLKSYNHFVILIFFVKLHNEVKFLIWNSALSSSYSKCMQAFSFYNIFITSDKKYFTTSDYVIVPSRKYQLDAPSNRPVNQKWIWLNMDIPSIIQNKNQLNNIFNLTASYRSDSDIHTPFGLYFSKRHHLNGGYCKSMKLLESQNAIPKKKRAFKKLQFAAWIVSDWDDNSERVNYFYELAKYIPIDVFGHSHIPLSRNADVCSRVSSYKFYLSFETGQYKEYITEKVWYNAFRCKAVPIILGPDIETCNKLLPPNSFIHAKNFASPKKLADFLILLSSKSEKYDAFQKWRKDYDTCFIAGNEEDMVCKIAMDVLKYKTVQPRVISNLTDWIGVD